MIYKCPECGKTVTGKPDMNIFCGDCRDLESDPVVLKEIDNEPWCSECGSTKIVRGDYTFEPSDP